MNQKEMLNQWEIARTVDETAADLDSRNLDKALAAFTEDAILHTMENGTETATVSGKSAIRAHIQKRMNNMEVLFHNNGTRVIDVRTLDQAALSLTHCIVRIIQKEPRAIVNQYETIQDKMIKVNGYWYIVERTVDIVSRSIV